MRVSTSTAQYARLGVYLALALGLAWAGGKQTTPESGRASGLELLGTQLSVQPEHLLLATGLVPVTLVLNGIFAFVTKALMPVRTQARPSATKIDYPLQIFPLSACTAFGEEVLFRGPLQSMVGPCFASLAFGLSYAIQHRQARLAICQGLIGLWFGSIVIWTGSLCPAIFTRMAAELLIYQAQWRAAQRRLNGAGRN